MCLATKWSYSKIADRDIKVFKILEKPQKSYNLRTPIQHVVVRNIPCILKAKGKPKISKFLESYNEVAEGFIHAFLTKKDAISRLREYCKKGIVAECYIEKGTEYFVGLNGDICAPKMSLNRVIVEYRLGLAEASYDRYYRARNVLKKK